MAPDDEKIRVLHALIVGPRDTPYEGGFFYFVFTYPENYPLQPPHVKFMTTDNGKVRFNPNLYQCGKVCLSILGTWNGPSWTSAMTTKGILISIQSIIMNEHPYFNEPGYESQKSTPPGIAYSKAYNHNIKYHTMRVAVIDMVANCRNEIFSMPSVLKEMVIHLFRQNQQAYIERLTKFESEQPSTPDRFNKFLTPSFVETSSRCNWLQLRRRLEEAIASLKNRENIATILYQSLREAYIG